jgi:hypothetical protein
MSKINVEAVRAFRRLYPNVPQRKLSRLMEDGAASDVGGFKDEHISIAADASGTGRFYQYYNIIRRHDRLERQKLASTVTGRLSGTTPNFAHTPEAAAPVAKWNVALLQDTDKDVVVSVRDSLGACTNFYVGQPGNYKKGLSVNSLAGVNRIDRKMMLSFSSTKRMCLYEELTNFDVDGEVVGLIHGHGSVLVICTATNAYLITPMTKVPSMGIQGQSNPMKFYGDAWPILWEAE